MKIKISKTILVLMTLVLLFVLVACKSNQTIKDLSGDCGFTAEGEFEKGSTLVVQALHEATDKQKEMISSKGICIDYNMQVYDISVKKNNVKIQPNGKVKITLDFNGDSPNGYTVFHFKNDTEMEVLKATITNNKLSFETTSFSVFIIGENKPEEYSYNITYELDGGEFQEGVILPNKYDSKSEFPFTLPIPKKSGYTFKGWKNSYGVEIIEITANMRGDITLTAQWEKSNEPAYIMSEDGKTVTFGSYPQTLVKDETLIKKLTEKVVLLPVENDGRGWLSFEFYSKNNIKDYAWYKDIELDGNFYRGIYFNEYRMYQTRIESSSVIDETSPNISFVYDNGVKIKTLYWFKFEPIKWRVLTKTDDKAFLMCDNAIFAMQFQHNEEGGIPCDYANSDIRKWLNDSFYRVAFGASQKDIIRDTEVDNSIRGANPKEKEYETWNTGEYGTEGENCVDKVFLLSLYDVTNPEYGFAADPLDSASKWKKTGRSVYWTDYGIYVGGLKYKGIDPCTDCDWWLRSPQYRKTGSYSQKKNLAIMICGSAGNANTCGTVYYTSNGVVPALWINL